MFSEAEFIIQVYCLVEQYYQTLPQPIRQAGFPPAFSDVEALSMEVVGEYLGLATDQAIYDYFHTHYLGWFPRLPDRSLVERQWAKLWAVKQQLWQALVHASGQGQDPLQVIDTLPLPICHVKRAPRRHIFRGELAYDPDYGFCAAKAWYYFGFKGGLRISMAGMIVHAPLLPARPHDVELVEPLLAGVPADTTVLGDKAFLDLQRQSHYQQEDAVLLKTPLRNNMTARPRFTTTALENKVRHLIETVVGQLTDRFHVQQMKVRKGWTLVAKWYRKILAHTLCVFINLMYGRKPTQLDSLVH